MNLRNECQAHIDTQQKSEWECTDLKCTHYDDDRCTLGFCEPDILDDNITVQDNKNNVTDNGDSDR